MLLLLLLLHRTVTRFNTVRTYKGVQHFLSSPALQLSCCDIAADLTVLPDFVCFLSKQCFSKAGAVHGCW
jgi:hypothetical protein